jgi:hypothetical protein
MIEIISDRVSCIILWGRWRDIVLNFHASYEDKSDYTTDRLSGAARTYVLSRVLVTIDGVWIG